MNWDWDFDLVLDRQRNWFDLALVLAEGLAVVSVSQTKQLIEGRGWLTGLLGSYDSEHLGRTPANTGVQKPGLSLSLDSYVPLC